MIYPYSVIGDADSLKDFVSCDYNLALVAIQQAIGEDNDVVYFQTDKLLETEKNAMKNNINVDFPTENIITVPHFGLDEIERRLLLINANICQVAMEGFRDVYYYSPVDSFIADILRIKGYKVKNNHISW